MIDDIPYHSALKGGKLQNAKPLPHGVVHFDHRGNSVQVWDVNTQPVPDEFKECDLIYAEPMWPAGVKNFDARAGAATPSYGDHAKAVAALLRGLRVPTVMTTSKAMLKHMPRPDMTMVIDLNGNPADVAFWNGAVGFGDDNRSLIRDLATRYNVVGDWCAGYGTTGRLFIEVGKQAHMADYNADCCGFIAEHMEFWG